MNESNSSSDNLRLAQERFELVAKATHDVIRDWNLEEKSVWWNDGMESLFGYKPEELEPGPDSWYNRIHPDDQERVLNKINTVIERRENNWADYYRFRRSDGSYAHVHDRGYTILNEHKPVRMVTSMQDISESVIIRQALEESESRLRFTLDSAELHTWDFDTENNIIKWDAGAQNLHGFVGNNQVSYEDIINNIYPGDQTRVRSAVQEALRSGSDGKYDVQFRIFNVPKAQLTWVHSSGQAYFKADGSVYRFAGVTKDVTKQILNSEKAAIVDEQASIAIEGSSAGSFSVTLDTDEIIYSPTFLKILTGKEINSKKRNFFINYIHKDDLSIRAKAYEAMAEKGGLVYEARFVWSDNSVHWVRVIGRYLYNSAGEATTLSGIVLDITERVEVEKKLIASEATMRTLVQQAPVAIGLLKGESMIIEAANPSILEVWGKDENVIGKTLVQGLPELEGQGFLDILQEVYHTGVPYRGSESLVKLNRKGALEDVYFNFIYTPIKDSKDLVSGILIVATEVTQLVAARLGIEDSEKKFRNLIAEAPVATSLFVGRDLIIDLPNETMLKIWGKGNDVAGKKLLDVLPELVDQPFIKILDDVFTTGIAYHSDAARTELFMDGKLQTFYFDFTYKPLRDSSGEVYAIVDMAIDVTAQVESRKQLEKSKDQYRQLADQLEVRIQQRTNELKKANQELTISNNNLQQFAYAASHDMQEPLRKIQSFSSRLQAAYSDKLDTQGVFMLTRMQDAAKRMSFMIDDLLAYSRLTTRDGDFSMVKLETVINEVLSDLEITIQEANAKISVEKLLPVWGNHRQLNQLMQNIISNAIKYRNPDDVPFIQIRSSRIHQYNEEISSDLAPDQDYIKIEIQDNGIGFNTEYLDRIFQMFQRLHGRSEYSGSGIGLALCRKVVQNHHGFLTAVSEQGKGSTFIIYLPDVTE